MNYNIEKKKGNGLLILIVVLLIVLIGVGATLIYQNYQNNITKEDNVEQTDKNNKVEETDKDDNKVNSNIIELSINEILERDVFSLYNSIFPLWYEIGNSIEDGDGLEYYYHTADRRLVRDMPQKFKLYITSTYVANSGEYERYRNDDGGYRIPEDIFKYVYADLFGDDNYKFEEVDCCYGVLKHDGEEKLTDEVFLLTECGGTGMPNIQMDILKVEKNLSNNELYIYEVAGFLDYLGEMGNNEGDLFNLYKDYNQTELVAQNLEYFSDTDLDLLFYKDKLSTYKYTFKLEDDNYYFYSVERVK